MQGNGLDLAALDVKTGADQGFKLELHHPITGAPLGIWILILGSDSDAYRQQLREFRQRAIERLKRDQRHKMSDEEADDEGLELLAAVTRGWSDNLKLDGEALAFSPANARKLYADKRLPWIQEQVHRGIHNRANFLPGNGTSS